MEKLPKGWKEGKLKTGVQKGQLADGWEGRKKAVKRKESVRAARERGKYPLIVSKGKMSPLPSPPQVLVDLSLVRLSKSLITNHSSSEI